MNSLTCFKLIPIGTRFIIFNCPHSFVKISENFARDTVSESVFQIPLTQTVIIQKQ